MSAKTDYLQAIAMLKDLPPQAMQRVEDETRLVEYTSGHHFFMPDDPGERLYILKSGRVQLYRISPDGRKLIVRVLHPGAIFGHMALIGQRLHNTYAQALDDVIICIWSREAVERVLIENPSVALRFLETLGERLADAEDRLSEITFKNLPARLAGLLLRLVAKSHFPDELHGYTHQDLADMLGTYRETVTQILNDFKSAEMITLSRKCVHIRNPAALREVAGGRPER